MTGVWGGEINLILALLDWVLKKPLPSCEPQFCSRHFHRVAPSAGYGT